MSGIPGNFLGNIRGGQIIRTLNAADPTGSVYVRCDLHPNDWIPVKWSVVSGALHLVDIAEAALRTCVGCLEASRWTKTRFPEGAEL